MNQLQQSADSAQLLDHNFVGVGDDLAPEIARPHHLADGNTSHVCIILNGFKFGGWQANANSEEASLRAQKQLEEKMQLVRKEMKWLGTQEGQLAYRFFQQGSGLAAATCNGHTWDIEYIKGEKYCIPNRRDWIGGEKERYGWKIP